jgi:hypothetical protein
MEKTIPDLFKTSEASTVEVNDIVEEVSVTDLVDDFVVDVVDGREERVLEVLTELLTLLHNPKAD